MSHRAPSACFVLTCSLVGCSVGRDLRAGIERYERGNYNSTAQICWEMSEHEDEMNDKAHVRYLVYCGLTQYRLGRREEALRMLSQGSGEYARGRTGWLKPAIVDEMLKALDDLQGRSTPAPPPSPDVLSGGEDGGTENL
jgi:hypothetical protein